MIIPVLPLRDVVIFPKMVIPLFVGREKSVNALEAANAENQKIFLTAQKKPAQDNPLVEDLYSLGTICTVLQLLKLPDGTLKVLVEGLERGQGKLFVEKELEAEPLLDLIEAEAGEIVAEDQQEISKATKPPEKSSEKPKESLFLQAEVEPVVTEVIEDQALEFKLRSLVALFEQYVQLNKKIPVEMVLSLAGIHEPVRLIDTIAAHMPFSIAAKQSILETVDFKARIDALHKLVEEELNLLEVEQKLSGTVKRQIEDTQRRYLLNEKMKAIQKELGDLGESDSGELKSETEALIDKIEKTGMPPEAKEKVMTEVNKLKLMPPMSAEATVSRNYIDCMIKVPWEKHSDIQNDLNLAETILNQDHYGLEKVKERILEYLAVQQRVRKLKGPILCLVGPPGVGKTSLGQSIARATQRKFVRMSLGGVRDEAEIRGHRRTYIGALPGKIIQKLSKAEVNNPLFLLDEIDKMAMDFRGDPASALLEVLDPEQNKTFNDHYLEVDYDLSDVLFVATANTLDIPPPLLDRMEVIRLSGYTEDEKLNIATHYLIPKQMENNGVAPEEFSLSEAAIRDIIRYYTREAGVRNLERELSKLCRKIVKKCLSHPKAEGEVLAPVLLGPEDLEQYLGVRRFRFGQAENYDQIGQVTGLAWTEVGGDILTIEAVAVPGKGNVTTTGKLGEVMQESIQAAVTVVRSRAQALGIPLDFYEKQDIHVHVPEGAIPKDGPSAGVGMVTALVSMLTGIPVHKDVAMTGEITLRGQVLPIGGLKEKLLAARRAGIVDVIIPDENERELKEIPKTVYEGMNIHPVRWIDEVLAIALTRLPLPDASLEAKALDIPKKLVERRKK